MHKKKRLRRTKNLVAAGLTALALLPTLGVAWNADARSESESPWTARQRVLKKMSTDPSVLINVTHREMPASPDILNLGKRSTKALERCLADNASAGLRLQCAQILGALGDRRALPTVRSALDDWEASVRYQAVRTLEAMPDPASFGPLTKLFKRQDEEEFVRGAVLEALGALGSKQAVQFLRKEMRRRPKEKDPDRRADAFRALWRSRHLMARATLVGDMVHALRTDHDGLVLAVTEASSELRDRRLVRPLIPLMQHGHAEIRNKAVYALGKIGDKTATRALVKHMPRVREARMLNNIAFALERLDRKAFYPAIDKLAAHKQAIIRLNAAFVVGDVKRPEGLPILKRVLGDPSDFVKTSAIVAIGKLGTKDGITELTPFVDAKNPSIRQEAVYAINELSGGKRADLVHDKLFDSAFAKSRRGVEVRRRAAVKLGELGDARVRDYLLACYESHQCGLWEVSGFFESDKKPSTAGRLLLAWSRGRLELTELVGDMRPPGVLAMATSSYGSARASGQLWPLLRSADLVGDVGDPKGIAHLQRELDAKDTWLRLHVAVAAVRLGHPKATAVLLERLDNAPVTWLRRAARLLARIEEPAARKQLRPEFEKRSKSSDVDVALASAAILLAWDPEKGFFRFLDALASSSTRERELALAYLRRNHAKRLTWVMRRALARETRPFTKDLLRTLLDGRP